MSLEPYESKLECLKLATARGGPIKEIIETAGRVFDFIQADQPRDHPEQPEDTQRKDPAHT